MRTRIMLLAMLAIALLIIVPGCGGSNSSVDITDPNPSGGSGHVNTDAVQNCIEQGNDPGTCMEIWQVK
jgi:hypothetical protein